MPPAARSATAGWRAVRTNPLGACSSACGAAPGRRARAVGWVARGGALVGGGGGGGRGGRGGRVAPVGGAGAPPRRARFAGRSGGGGGVVRTSPPPRSGRQGRRPAAGRARECAT